MRNRIFIILIFLYANSKTQVVNIEQARIRTDTTGWSGLIETSFQAMQYDQLLLNIGIKGTAQWKGQRDIFLLLGDIGYAASIKEKFNNAGLMHLRYNHKLTSLLRMEVFTQAQYNQLLDLEIRVLIGSGPRFVVLRTSRSRIYAGTILMAEGEQIRGIDKINNTARWSQYLSFNFSGKTWAYSGTIYFQPKFTNYSDFRISGQHSISTDLGGRLHLKVELSHFADTDPPVGVVRSTMSSLLGIGIDL